MQSFSPNEIKAYQQRILSLKKKLNAVILAHNYQRPEVQDIADLLGDSLGLAKKAAETDANVIVFCGVRFMAESAKILSPGKKVLHPDSKSLCPMAGMVDADIVRNLRKKFPKAAFVAYVNTTAEVKAEVDVCCTSANAVKTVEALEQEEIVFLPDINLGQYVKTQVKDKIIHLYPGHCYTHNNITPEQVEELKNQHRDAKVLVHPECQLDVIELADSVCSTSGMIEYSMSSDAKEFIIVTEREMTYRLKKEAEKNNLDKAFYPVENALCKDMKKINIEKVVRALETMSPELKLSDEITKKAKKPLDRMLEIGR